MFTPLRFGFALAAALGFTSTLAAVEPAVQKIDPSQPVGAIIESPVVDRSVQAGIISPQQNDERIVRWLSVDNRGLIECSKLAVDHSTNDAVKQLAQRIVDEHQRFQNDFGKHSGNVSANNDRPNAPTQAGLVRDDGQSRGGALLFYPTDFLAVKEKTCDELHGRAKKEMQRLTVADFDKAYLAHMIFGHEALMVSVDVLDNNASQTLQPQLKTLQDMSEHHLHEAKQLCEQLHPATTAARSGTVEQK